MGELNDIDKPLRVGIKFEAIKFLKALKWSWAMIGNFPEKKVWVSGEGVEVWKVFQKN